MAREQLIAEFRDLRLGQLIENVYGHRNNPCIFQLHDEAQVKQALAERLADLITGDHDA